MTDTPMTGKPQLKLVSFDEALKSKWYEDASSDDTQRVYGISKATWDDLAEQGVELCADDRNLATDATTVVVKFGLCWHIPTDLLYIDTEAGPSE